MPKKSAKRQNSGIPLKKEILEVPGDSPELDPIFVNNFQVSHQREDVFIDVGIVPLDDVLPPKTSARFVVLERLVMSPYSLVLLQNQIQTILDGLRKGGALNAQTAALYDENRWPAQVSAAPPSDAAPAQNAKIGRRFRGGPGSDSGT